MCKEKKGYGYHLYFSQGKYELSNEESSLRSQEKKQRSLRSLKTYFAYVLLRR